MPTIQWLGIPGSAAADRLGHESGPLDLRASCYEKRSASYRPDMHRFFHLDSPTLATRSGGFQALSEIDLPNARKEIHYALPECEKRLKTLRPSNEFSLTQIRLGAMHTSEAWVSAGRTEKPGPTTPGRP